MHPPAAVPASPSRVAHRFAPFGTTIFAEMSRKATEAGAINLGQGFPDFEGPAFVKEAAARALRDEPNQYAPLPGLPSLRRAVASRFEKDSGLTTDPDAQVTITAGCTEALAASLLGLVNPGEEVVLFEPYYDSYRACVAMAGATPRFVTLRAPSFTFEPEELHAAVTEKTRAIVVNTPHNPTGRVFTREELGEISRVCVERDIVAITDEVYEHLVYEGEHVRLATLPGMAERTLTLSSLGKTFSLTGWKIGWAIGPPALTRAVRAAHQFITFAVATPLQHGAAAALEAPDAFYTDLAQAFRARRDMLCDALEHAGFILSERPAGGYFALADFSPLAREGEDDIAFCDRLIRDIGVAAIPPSFFYENKQEGRRLARFAFCKHEETLRAAAERLRALRG